MYSLLVTPDWVFIKCMELGLDPRIEYSQILERRVAISKWEKIEKQIIEATSLEELNSIKIFFNTTGIDDQNV